MSSFNFKHGFVHLLVWVTLRVIFQLCLKQSKKAQDLNQQRIDLVLLRTSAVKGKRQWPVFSRHVSSSSHAYRDSLPDSFHYGWVHKSDWIWSMECGQEGLWVISSLVMPSILQMTFQPPIFFLSVSSLDKDRFWISKAAEDIGSLRTVEETGSLHLYLDCHLPHCQWEKGTYKVKVRTCVAGYRKSISFFTQHMV